jgi:hypothetical protein
MKHFSHSPITLLDCSIVMSPQWLRLENQSMKQRAAMQQEHDGTASSQTDHVGASTSDPTRLVY